MRSKVLALTLTAFFALAPVAPAKPPHGHTPVTICHHAGPNKVITITVDDDAVAKHVSQHGDTIGPCPVTQPPVDNPPPTDTTPTPTEPTDTPTPPETPAVVVPPVNDQPPTDTVPTDTTVTPKQLVSPDRARVVHKRKPHAQVVARVRRQQRALVHRVAQERVREQLPYTGLPVGLIAVLGGVTLAGGIALRRRILTD